MEIQAEQRQRRPAVDFGLGVDKVMETLAEGNTEAANALQSVLLLRGGDVLNTCLDLIDMDMHGDQIAAAWDFVGGHPKAFVEACARRDAAMVDAVNTRIQDRTARCHSEQRRMTATDFAVQSALAAAGADAPIARMDAHADAVHEFFMNIMKTMHATHQYDMNFRLNTGLEGGVQAVFSIRMVEFLDKDGQPWTPTSAQVAAADKAQEDTAEGDKRIGGEDG